MTDASARWRRVEDLCQAALERDARDRASFLTAACGEDAGLRREVDALLAREQSAEGFLGSPLGAVAANVLTDRAASLVGRRVGSYEIVAPLGAGGMGEVYRAHDSKLKREVAIKVLPADVASDRERLARFQREAEVLASLNHPHIAHVYGIEENALVMELVEGQDLSQRISRGPIPIDEALPIAKQIAEALEAAHDAGIIHRDLKPANIKVRDDGTVKVLDFGLAKALDCLDAKASSLQTITTPAMTMRGVILGTAAYMAPEQAKGKAVDRRTDIWAFGCVLYEMLTGARAFTGDDATDAIVAVVSKEPDWQRLPATASGVRPLLARCLKKDVKQRLQSIGDARILIEELISGTSDEAAAARAPAAVPRRRLVPLVIAGLAAGAVIGALAMWATVRPVPQARALSSRFEIVPPPAQSLAVQGADRDIAISPDGQHIVYRADAGRGQLVLRAIDRLEVHTVAGVADARAPFFSPDGQWIGFFDGAGLKKAPIAGGSAIMIWKDAIVPRGASWGDDNSIVFASRDTVGLRRVSASGGEPTVLTTPDPAQGESHWYPSALPGGRGVLFTITAPNQMESAQVAVLDLKTGQRKTLIRGGSQAEYVPSGHLLYAAAGTLRAVRFDIERLEVLSDPVPVVEDVWMAGGGAANYAISRTGTLVYVPESGARRPRSLVWLDRNGQETPIGAPPRMYTQPRLSPDGTRVAVAIRDEEQDIWIWELARETGLTRLTFNPGVDQSPVWTPDGRGIVFASQRGGAANLFMQAADGTTDVNQQLTTGADDQSPAWVAPDGTGVVGWVVTRKAKGDIVRFPRENPASRAGSDAASVAGLPSVEPLVSTQAMEFHPEISLDGRYMAYQSNESGRLEVYVRPFPHVDQGRWQVSTGGGTKPAWARDGRELFYVDQENTLTAVPVQTSGATFAMGNPAKLFETAYAGTLTSLRDYDVASDGRFLMIKENVARDRNAMPGMVVVQNWFEELKAKIAVGK